MIGENIHPLTQELIDAGRVFPVPCCGRLARPATIASRDAPGTIRRMSLTVCDTCHGKQKNRDRRQADAATQACWDAYIANRRARGIPPEGLRYTAKEPQCVKLPVNSQGPVTNSASNGVTV